VADLLAVLPKFLLAGNSALVISIWKHKPLYFIVMY